MKIEMAIKNKIDKEPVVRLNARRGTETPGARPANRMTVNLANREKTRKINRLACLKSLKSLKSLDVRRTLLTWPDRRNPNSKNLCQGCPRFDRLDSSGNQRWPPLFVRCPSSGKERQSPCRPKSGSGGHCRCRYLLKDGKDEKERTKKEQRKENTDKGCQQRQ